MTLDTVRYWPLPASGSVERGYVLLPVPIVQLRVNELALKLIASPFDNPWLGKVTVDMPVAGLYTKFVGVPTSSLGHVKYNPTSFIWSSIVKPWFVAVVTDNIPVTLL